MIIDDEKITKDSLYFIAEAGVNHNGSISRAKRLVEAAANAGADAIKFQTFRAKYSVSKDQKKVTYQEESTDPSETQYEMLKNLELSANDHVELIKKCDSEDITFLSTPAANPQNVDLLSQVGISALKIGSSDLLNKPLLRRCMEEDVPLIISTGMATMDEIQKVYTMTRDHSSEVAFLHCVSEYPTSIQDVNLEAIRTMQEELNTVVGFSDHTISRHVPAYAASVGAQIIEKHLTLNRNLPGPDHQASLEPDEMSAAISFAREATEARGHGTKQPTSGERQSIDQIRRSIHANEQITKGDEITDRMLTVKRPNQGMSPMNYDQVTGAIATRNIDEGNPITADDLQF